MKKRTTQRNAHGFTAGVNPYRPNGGKRKGRKLKVQAREARTGFISQEMYENARAVDPHVIPTVTKTGRVTMLTYKREV